MQSECSATTYPAVPPPNSNNEEYQVTQRTLPAYASRDAFIQAARESQVLVVEGETGSGKTTQLPQFLLEAFGGSVVCTQPRRMAAISVAMRVAAEMNVPLGTKVGYAVRFDDHTSPATKVRFVTDGVLLRECIGNPLLEQYTCIVVDEAHERSLNTDILLGVLRGILRIRTDVRIVITSATLNATRFCTYFGGAPLFTIPGRTHPVHVRHLTTATDDWVADAAKVVISVHLQRPPGDILVFMTGQDDIEAICDELERRQHTLELEHSMLVLPMYSQLPQDQQERVFLLPPPNTRKVVVATNIAESSLTIEGIRYVIDAGYVKLLVYKPQLGLDALQTVPITQANATQRSGRAGRTAEGWAFRLYTKKEEMEEMFTEPFPEILRCNLSSVVLQLKTLGVDDVSDFPFLDAPSPESLTSSLYDLWILGALDPVTGHITSLGRELASFPLDPYMARLVVAGMHAGCAGETLTIVSMMAVPSVFIRSRERAEESDRARGRFIVPLSDHLTLLEVYNQWMAVSASKRDAWAASNFLHPGRLRRAADIRAQLTRIVTSAGNRRLSSAGADSNIVRRCVCRAYFSQAARVQGLRSYVSLRKHVSLHLHPTSALNGIGVLPPYVVYHSVVLTTQQYMTTVTAVDLQWLLEDGSVLYYTSEGPKPAIFSSTEQQEPPSQSSFKLKETQQCFVRGMQTRSKIAFRGV